MSERKELKLPDGKIVYIKNPGVIETQQADWEYSRIFNKALINGIMPRAALIEALKENNVLSDEEDNLINGIQENLTALSLDLEDAAKDLNKEKFEELRDAITEERSKLYVLIQKRSAILSHCAEEKANEARIMYLCFSCTEKEDGTKVWATLDEFKAEKDVALVNNVVYTLMLMLNGISEDYINELPENKITIDEPAG